MPLKALFLVFLCVQGEKLCVHTQYVSLSISLVSIYNYVRVEIPRVGMEH